MPSICSAVAIARAVELDRAAVMVSLTSSTVPPSLRHLDGGAGVADVALDLQRRPALRLQRGARPLVMTWPRC